MYSLGRYNLDVAGKYVSILNEHGIYAYSVDEECSLPSGGIPHSELMGEVFVDFSDAETARELITQFEFEANARVEEILSEGVFKGSSKKILRILNLTLPLPLFLLSLAFIPELLGWLIFGAAMLLVFCLIWK